MEPVGIIITYIIWTDWKSLPFNLSLFLFQLSFLVVGKIYGKVEVEWQEIWHAAQASHVRLCLRQAVEVFPTWEYISFSYPVAKLDYWTMTMVAHDRFKYYDPTFEPSDEFIAAMIQYAHDQVGKRYDWLQLILGYPVNFVLWLFWPPWWGKEKIRWFNLRGALEVCSSGWVADLRWAYLIRYGYSVESANKMLSEGYAEYGTIFFEGYDTAVIPPCLAPLSKNWREG